MGESAQRKKSRKKSQKKSTRKRSKLQVQERQERQFKQTEIKIAPAKRQFKQASTTKAMPTNRQQGATKAAQSKRQFKQAAASSVRSGQSGKIEQGSHSRKQAKQFVAAPSRSSVSRASKQQISNQAASSKTSTNNTPTPIMPVAQITPIRQGFGRQFISPFASIRQAYKNRHSLAGVDKSETTMPTLKLQPVLEAAPTIEREKTPAPAAFTVRGRVVSPWLVLGSLAFGFFMSLLDATVVNVAIPTIQTNLKTNLDTVGWVLTGYNLVFAVLLVTMGRFADQYGRKRVVMISMGIFSLGSLLCAFAGTIGSASGTSSINWLIAFRVLQGVGAAGLNPISLAIIIAVFPPQQRGMAVGLWGTLSGLASAIGPVLGGFLVEAFDWRSIFLVNLPFCLVGLLMVALFVPETSNPQTSKHVDMGGIITLSSAIFCLVLAISQSNSWGWTSPVTLALCAVALVTLILFIIIEMRQQEPIIDFSLFKTVSFTGANFTMLLFGLAIQGQFLLMVLFFQNARGFDQVHAAYAILPASITALIVSMLGGRLSRYIQSFHLAIIGMVAIALGFLWAIFITPATGYPILALDNVVLGAGIGLIFQTLPTLSMSEIPPQKLGVSSGVFNTFRQIGYSLGIAILLTVLSGQTQQRLPQAVTQGVQIIQQSSLPAESKQDSVAGLKQLASSMGSQSSSQSGAPQIDLQRYQSTGPQTEGTIVELKKLSGQINTLFATQVTRAFASSWSVSCLLAFIGAIVAAAASIVHQRRQSAIVPIPLEQPQPARSRPARAKKLAMAAR